jgi:hypothetical protein
MTHAAAAMRHEHARHEAIGEVVAVEDVPELAEKREAEQASDHRIACTVRASMPLSHGRRSSRTRITM